MRLSIAGLASLALLAFLAVPLSGCGHKDSVPYTRADVGYGGTGEIQATTLTPY